MRLYNDGLHFAPKLPKAWESCTFNINYNNAVIRIRAEKDTIHFTLIDGESIHFTVYGEDVKLSKGDNETIIRNIKNRKEYKK
ncbi:MAG: glycosyl hydrolase family 65 protein, partial [Clostridiales bacterium]|nr:glycosyl hydrolase family 65 protein [Clostridiales bacterium]